ncbi:hypothetical protein NDU88_008245, partial [Pleurodeles waltl]
SFTERSCEKSVQHQMQRRRSLSRGCRGSEACPDGCTGQACPRGAEEVFWDGPSTGTATLGGT